MGFFSFFRNKTTENAGYKYELITERSGFYSWNGQLYQSDIIRSCTRPKSKAIGKLLAKHVRKSKDGLKINPEPYIRFLLEEPNPYMTGQLLQEKLTTQLELNNNAFALIVRDDFGLPYQIYPLPSTAVEAIHSKSGELFLKFSFSNGKIHTFPYTDIIHLRQDFNENDIFGDSPAKVITSLMEVINTTDQGIVKAIKNSNLIRWLLKFKTTLKPKDITNQVEEFKKSYMDVGTGTGGVAAVDTKADIEQVKPNSYVPNAAVMDRTTKRVYNFFNTNEKIVQSSYNEDEWNSYYESQIEPLAKQLAEEFTRKLFNRKQRSFGNKIFFEASNLQYASAKTKLNLQQMVDRGSLTPNEWREVMGLGPIEGGDKPVRRLDTAVVKEGDDDNED